MIRGIILVIIFPDAVKPIGQDRIVSVVRISDGDSTGFATRVHFGAQCRWGPLQSALQDSCVWVRGFNRNKLVAVCGDVDEGKENCG
jgi:hypothetical protein